MAKPQLVRRFAAWAATAKVQEVPESTRDEARRALGPVNLGKLHRFIDGDFDRGLAMYREFPASYPQNVPVYRRDLLQWPLRCALGDDLIKLVCQWEHAKHDLPRKFGQLVGKRLVLQAVPQCLARRVVSNINFVKSLQGNAARPGSGLHAALRLEPFVIDVLHVKIQAV